MATPFVTKLQSSPPPSSVNEQRSYRIETYRFVLTDEEEWELNQQLEHLANAMPEEASVRLSLTMDEDYYFRGVLSVQTMSRAFEAIEEGLDPLEVFNELEDDILEKISHWGYSTGYSRRIS